ncbi:related to monooxygenase [Cephalotrichum gorgonifer]|uniref:Related to monooxygenase n=1 Tax=Cephalotrichum gorgonifer TaxID=2041049 RepID=A0AAE8T0A2_9PEZI|nr:related to monooxygenase [Cephalotrichum gorgonifer]
MEETTVLIVGAGPSGLALGALLGRMNIKVVILEKDAEVCEDPRGIVVNGDAVRISYQIGIGEGLTKRIGKDIGVLNFHRGNFRTSPFMTFDINIDWAEQSVSNNVTQFQPNYEREIRALLKEFPTCELRTSCEVIGREEKGDHSIIEYLDRDGTRKLIRTSWLVGADGKRGVVRKKFLEPEGIRQVESDWTYVGTWVAANLHITTPTPKSHPEFPLWKLGYTPEQVHDLFWPSGFHFCNYSERPAVSGRFGPPGSGFWRHEYSVEPTDSTDNVESQFWDLFGSWLVIPGHKLSRALKKTAVEFPRDCIKLLRCRPFTFAVKVVNEWYCRKTILIGDAAHVFPPFGGQGIATGIRDAQGLSWRLAMMSRVGISKEVEQKILLGWSQERRHAWKAAMRATKLNGSIVNLRSFFGGLLYRISMRALWWFPWIARYRTRQAFKDKLIYTRQTCPDGFFLESADGGQKVAQVWVRRAGEEPKLSDSAFIRDMSHISLLVVVRNAREVDPAEVAETLAAAALPETIITMDDVTYYHINGSGQDIDIDTKAGGEVYQPCNAEELTREGITPIQGYNYTAVQDRLASSAKFVLLRPDFFVHSVASDADGLLKNLKEVGAYFK